MFNKMFDMFDDLEPQKVVEVVNLVWNDKDRIMETVDLVWENRTKIREMIEYLQDNKEKITQLISELPDMLNRTGDNIEAAGSSAIKASAFLTGSDDDDDGVSARELAELAADALERCFTELKRASGIMSTVGQEIDDIRIPSIEPTYREVMGFNVVSGLEFGEMALVDNAADRLKEGSGRLTEIGKDLSTVAKQLRALGGKLTEAGGDLNNLGGQLRESGGTLRSLSNFVDKD